MGQPQTLRDHLARVEAYESRVHALLGWDADAARVRAESCSPGPLHGWAIGVKDIIDVAGLPTRCGVDFLPDEPAAASADIVERLEKLGAYVFSKVVTTSFAYFDPGPTTNPWHAEHTPGGSSMGSAAAVATGMVRAALGTQTVASVNRPASFCGTVGFKPTYERMSRAGVFPFSPSVDTVGFFTSNVADLETLCGALFDAPVPDAAAPQSSKTRIALVEDLYCDAADEEMLAALRHVGEQLSRGGFKVENVRLPESLRAAYPNHMTLIAAELAQSHADLLPRYESRYPRKILELIDRGRSVSPDELEESRERREQLEDEFGLIFSDYDFVLAPGAPGPAPHGLSATGDPRMSLIFTHARAPSLTLPVSLSDSRLPLGVQFVAAKGKDLPLLAAARQVEALVGFEAELPC